MAKNAIVTGASSGIGRACALALANEGFDLCLNARREKRLQELEAELRDTGRDCIYVCGDLTDPGIRKELFEKSRDKWGHIDVLLNNAGYAQPGAVEEVKEEDARKQFEINFFSALSMMQLAGPIMREQNSGRIINISSISGKITFPAVGIYSASKYALEAISDAARREYRPWNIKVILIEPGVIDTEIWQVSKDKAEAHEEDWATSPFSWLYEFQLDRVEKIIKGEAAPPDVVAKAVVHAATSKRPKTRYCMPTEAQIRKMISKLPDKWVDWLIYKGIKTGK